MKKPVYVVFSVMFAVILGACAKATSQPTGETINPGDRIGDFLITTGAEGEVIYPEDLECVTESNLDNSSCKATVGTKVNVTIAVYEGTYGEHFEEVWENYNYELFIENRPVNLPAFGFIDFNRPISGKVRHWNVVVSTDKPGEIMAQISGAVYGSSFIHTTTYIFRAP